MYAEQVIERIYRLTNEPVFDPQQLDRVGRRVTRKLRMIKVFVVNYSGRWLLQMALRRWQRRRRRRARGGHERILGAVDVFVPQTLQIVIDAAKLGVHLETLHNELRLDATHAQVLDVHEQVVDEKRRVRIGLVPAQIVHADRVAGDDDGQARGDHGQRKRPVSPELRGRRWRIRLERPDGRPIPGHVRLAFVHDGDRSKCK